MLLRLLLIPSIDDPCFMKTLTTPSELGSLNVKKKYSDVTPAQLALRLREHFAQRYHFPSLWPPF